MKPLSHSFALLGLILPLALSAAEKRSGAAATVTFYINELKCSSCASSIEESVRKVPSVTKIEDLSESTGYARISFDPKVASYHQIAQAVFAAAPVHGDPYVASVKFTIPEYSKGGNAAKVDAVFAQSKNDIRVECKNKKAGEFSLFFNPLTVSAAKKGPQGWNTDAFVQAISGPAPKGLGLKIEFSQD